MQIGMIGLGRMGANMVRRLLTGGHQCAVFDRSPKAVQELVDEKAVGSSSLADFVQKLAKPRVVWLMVPAAVVDQTIGDLLSHLERDDILIDGGNSYYIDDIRRAKELAPKGIHYVDVGTSGGVWGLERGYAAGDGKARASWCARFSNSEAAEWLDPSRVHGCIVSSCGCTPRNGSRSRRTAHGTKTRAAGAILKESRKFREDVTHGIHRLREGVGCQEKSGFH